MIKLTKIFHFEMAHAIHGYPGFCNNIHGHSYEIHVTVAPIHESDCYLPSPGYEIDFKDIKTIVRAAVIEKIDHKLILSKKYVAENPSISTMANLIIWENEPSAENILFYIKKTLFENFPDNVKLVYLKLFETKDSYAEWENENKR